MPSSEPQDPKIERDVLTNLPRSRRQRPSPRREAARQAMANAETHAKVAASNSATAAGAKLKSAPLHVVPPTPRQRVPRAGYATPNGGHTYGNADPAGLLAELTRTALRLLPG